MSQIISKLWRLRREAEAKTGKKITQQNVADGSGVNARRIMFLELGKFAELLNPEIIGLSEYYSRVLGRPITYNDMFEIELDTDPNNRMAYGTPQLHTAP